MIDHDERLHLEADFHAYLRRKCAKLRRSVKPNSLRYPMELWRCENLLEVAGSKPLFYQQALQVFAETAERVAVKPSSTPLKGGGGRLTALDGLASYAGIVSSFPSPAALLDLFPYQAEADELLGAQGESDVVVRRRLILAKTPATARFTCSIGSFPDVRVKIETDLIACADDGRAARDALWDAFDDELGASANRVTWTGNLRRCEALWVYRRCYATAMMKVDGQLKLSVDLTPKGVSPAAKAWFAELDLAGAGA